jgi:hypothetical protein
MPRLLLSITAPQISRCSARRRMHCTGCCTACQATSSSVQVQVHSCIVAWHRNQSRPAHLALAGFHQVAECNRSSLLLGTLQTHHMADQAIQYHVMSVQTRCPGKGLSCSALSIHEAYALATVVPRHTRTTRQRCIIRDRLRRESRTSSEMWVDWEGL